MDESEFMSHHRSHDIRHLMARWRRVAKACGLLVQPFAHDHDEEVYQIQPRRPRKGSPLYLSAGVHGDEPAGVLALLIWAENNHDLLSDRNVLLFPIFNPYGLRENTRADSRGIDLNRTFQNRKNPLMRSWQELIQGRRFSFCLCLHEDYDANGSYLYELTRSQEQVGRRLLEAARPHIAPDSRRTIEGRRGVDDGLLRRRTLPDMPDAPEAVFLFANSHTDISLTFETPSEFSLYRRVAAQMAAIDAMILWESGI